VWTNISQNPTTDVERIIPTKLLVAMRKQPILERLMANRTTLAEPCHSEPTELRSPRRVSEPALHGDYSSEAAIMKLVPSGRLEPPEYASLIPTIEGPSVTTNYLTHTC
jgi:hypothetical protein